MPVYTNRPVEYADNVCGGEGRMIRDRLNLTDKLGGICDYVVCNSLEPGCSIGQHTHTGETETYYITRGTGAYTEDGVEYAVKAGDVLFCPDGGTHAIANNGEDLLSFVVVIQKPVE